VKATADLAQPPEQLFSFLCDLRNHWRLSPAFVDVERVDGDGDGARIRIVGPLGLARRARTRIVEEREPELLRGVADVGRRTEGAVTWRLEPHAGGTRVTLAAEVVAAAWWDRLVLALGGRLWLQRGLRQAVRRLGELA
jgi:carbon monoxide dehydrogenase subunit G